MINIIERSRAVLFTRTFTSRKTSLPHVHIIQVSSHFIILRAPLNLHIQREATASPFFSILDPLQQRKDLRLALANNYVKVSNIHSSIKKKHTGFATSPINRQWPLECTNLLLCITFILCTLDNLGWIAQELNNIPQLVGGRLAGLDI